MSSDASGAKTPDPFEFLKALWAPMGLPMPGLVTPTLDVADIEKRITELKSVESWLNLNLNVLRMTIQGLEMQKSTLDAVKGMQGNMAAAARVMQGSAGSTAAGSTAAGATAMPPAGQASPPGAAMDAWWSVLQQAQKAAADAMGQAASKPASGEGGSTSADGGTRKRGE